MRGEELRRSLPQTCPACGSSSVIWADGTDEACACGDCNQLYVPDFRPEPLKQMCDDCAFRPGSPERSDAYKWMQIIEATIIEQQHPFHCHKGLACELDAGGSTIRYLRPDPGQKQLTQCAGWKAHLRAYKNGTPWRKL